ncbi:MULTISPECIES: VanZ family protein [unclassified Sinorhizobium]|uniref:VanZ family protein n=1 Tax=unclassified Sinorhizobium TaxID=2613772 RepID=UPI003525663A
MRTAPALKFVAWIILAAIFIVSIAPVWVEPTLVISENTDRALGFLMAAFAFILAYPQRPIRLAALLICAAVISELPEFLWPGKHALVEDAMAKSGGVVLGVTFGWLFNHIRPGLKRHFPSPYDQ